MSFYVVTTLIINPKIYLFIKGHQRLAFFEFFRTSCTLFVGQMIGDRPHFLVLGPCPFLRRRRHFLNRIRCIVTGGCDGRGRFLVFPRRRRHHVVRCRRLCARRAEAALASEGDSLAGREGLVAVGASEASLVVGLAERGHHFALDELVAGVAGRSEV